MSATHLFTIWNPKINPKTIEDHRWVLAERPQVNWLILSDPKSKGFITKLSNDFIEKINRQAKKQETLLFLLCLNIFRDDSLYVGKIQRIRKIINNDIDLKDEYLPSYYRKSIKKKGLKVHYEVVLNDMKIIGIHQTRNLMLRDDFVSKKFNFPFPCKVMQKKEKIIFKKENVEKRPSIRIIHDYNEKERRRCYFVIEPKSTNLDKPLTLSKKQVICLRQFINNPSGEPRSITPRTISKQLDCESKNDVIDKEYHSAHQCVYSINKKFEEHYSTRLISHKRGCYHLKAKGLKLP